MSHSGDFSLSRDQDSDLEIDSNEAMVIESYSEDDSGSSDSGHEISVEEKRAAGREDVAPPNRENRGKAPAEGPSSEEPNLNLTLGFNTKSPRVPSHDWKGKTILEEGTSGTKNPGPEGPSLSLGGKGPILHEGPIRQFPNPQFPQYFRPLSMNIDDAEPLSSMHPRRAPFGAHSGKAPLYFDGHTHITDVPCSICSSVHHITAEHPRPNRYNFNEMNSSNSCHLYHSSWGSSTIPRDPKMPFVLFTSCPEEIPVRRPHPAQITLRDHQSVSSFEPVGRRIRRRMQAEEIRMRNRFCRQQALRTRVDVEDPDDDMEDDMDDSFEEMRLEIDHMGYEELVELENRIGKVETEQLTDLDITLRLKRAVHGKATCRSIADSPQAETCPICQAHYEANEDIGILDCGHKFHTKCIVEWLLIKNECPICRQIGLMKPENDKHYP